MLSSLFLYCFLLFLLFLPFLPSVSLHLPFLFSFHPQSDTAKDNRPFAFLPLASRYSYKETFAQRLVCILFVNSLYNNVSSI
ncbi:hypothetical protein DOE52_10780 [Porphyromonas gingivalis]|nr:hypothetical protein DOE52_10780 [Porphyromonas gingivalis]